MATGLASTVGERTDNGRLIEAGFEAELWVVSHLG
jgi:hypothetical protein